MGIVNMTPDSFSGDGFGQRVDDAVRHGIEMAEAGADIVDVGGESTRPGASPVSNEEEIERVVPVISTLVRQVRVPISVDTRKAAVARRALDAGATIINDVWGLQADPEMAAVAAEYESVAVVTMHNHVGTEYVDMMAEILSFLRESVAIAESHGVPASQVIVDPGFGFGKTPAQNLEMIRDLGRLTSLEQPILIGPSNKSTLGLLLGGAGVDDRLEASLAAATLAIVNGADIVRMHAVRAMNQVRTVVDPIVRGITPEVEQLCPPGETL